MSNDTFEDICIKAHNLRATQLRERERAYWDAERACLLKLLDLVIEADKPVVMVTHSAMAHILKPLVWLSESSEKQTTDILKELLELLRSDAESLMVQLHDKPQHVKLLIDLEAQPAGRKTDSLACFFFRGYSAQVVFDQNRQECVIRSIT